jgi:hypothetical protein
MRPFSEFKLQDEIVYVIVAVSQTFTTSETPDVIVRVLIEKRSKHGITVTVSDGL